MKANSYVEEAVGEGEERGGGGGGERAWTFFWRITLWLKSQGMPISVYELAAESKFKHKKERKKHYMDLFSKNFKTLWLIFFTSWVSYIPGQIVQLLGQLITMNFGFFLHSPLNAHDLHFLFLSLQADGKKVRQWKHNFTPKEFHESDFFKISLCIIFFYFI